MVKWFIVILLGFGIWDLGFAPSAKAACWCSDPSFCACANSKTTDYHTNRPVGINPITHVSQIATIYCDSQAELDSEYRQVIPVCGGSPEILPYCAYKIDVSLPYFIDPHSVTCYGIEFFKGTTNIPGSIPENKLQQMNGPVVFTYTDGSKIEFGTSGVNEVLWCNSVAFCCARGDIKCSDDGVPKVTADSYCTANIPSDPNQTKASMCTGPSGAGESRLFFPHLKGISFLATLLQSMFNPAPSSLSNNALPAPKDEPNNISNPDVVTTKIQYHQGLDDDTQIVNQKDNNSSLKVNANAPPPLYNYNGTPPYKTSAYCSIADTRVNPGDGDDLLGPKITTRLTYTQKYSYPTAPHPAGCKDDNYSISETERRAGVKCCSEYEGNGYASIPPETIVIPNLIGTEDVYYKCVTRFGKDFSTEGRAVVFTKTPLVEYIYNTLVVGPQSVLKRIFPQGNPQEFKEIPGQANFSASAIGLNQEGLPVNIKAGDGSTPPTLNFPHLGSLYEYFLQGLQKALRPLGFSATPPNNQNTCTPTLPILPAVDPTCQTCSITFPSPSMKNIFESAATFYKVPVSVLVGVFYNEGGLNPSWGWDESKVLAASGPNCQVTNCDSSNVSNSGAKGPWQFLPNTWSSYSSAATEAGVSDGRTPNICNLLDSTFAAAKKIGQERGGATNYAIPECIGYVLNTGRGPSTSCYWSNPDIITAARQYLGYCEDPKNPDPKHPPRLSCVANPSTCYQQSVLDIATCVVSP